MCQLCPSLGNSIMALSKAAWMQSHTDFEYWCRGYDRMRQLQSEQQVLQDAQTPVVSPVEQTATSVAL